MSEHSNYTGVPDGWQLVPKEMTPEMEEAAEEARLANTDRYLDGAEVARDVARPMYEAAVAAAPSIPFSNDTAPTPAKVVAFGRLRHDRGILQDLPDPIADVFQREASKHVQLYAQGLDQVRYSAMRLMAQAWLGGRESAAALPPLSDRASPPVYASNPALAEAALLAEENMGPFRAGLARRAAKRSAGAEFVPILEREWTDNSGKHYEARARSKDGNFHSQVVTCTLQSGDFV